MLPAHVRAFLVFAAVALTACAAGDAPTEPSAGPVLDQTTPPPPPRSDSTTAAHPTQPWY